MDIWLEVISALWLLIPAYAANAWPPLARGRRPIDFGRSLSDGNRIFGDHKTIEGFLAGVMAGTAAGAIETYLYPSFNAYAGMWDVSLPTMNLLIGFMIALGAMFGDLGGAFIKRRLAMKPGSDAPLLDQLNFVIGAIIFSYAFTRITIVMMITMIILTIVMHRLVCIIGHLLKLKKVPW